MRDYSVLDRIRAIVFDGIDNAYDEGYDKGYKDGIANGNINDGTFAEKVKEAYNNGMNDAWECARKICLKTIDWLSGAGFQVSFPDYDMDEYEFSAHVITKYDAQEAIDKIKEWEEKQEQVDDEIKVGDEVNAPGFHAPVVVIALCDYDSVKVLSSLGDTGVHPKCNIVKTGRHFNQISEVLEQLKG